MSESERITTSASAPTPGGPTPYPTGHETSDVNLRAIVWGGIAIVTGIVVTGLVCWGLHAYYQGLQQRQADAVPVLTREVAERSLGEQIAALPSPRLEGLQMMKERLVLRSGPGQSRAFSVGPLTRFLRAGEEVSSRQFADGTQAAVVFQEEAGVEKALSVVMPPEEAETAEGEQVVTGTIVGIEAKDIAARRRQAEARQQRYGWVNQKEGIARIPVDAAREAILSGGLKKKWLPAGRSDPGKEDKR